MLHVTLDELEVRLVLAAVAARLQPRVLLGPADKVEVVRARLVWLPLAPAPTPSDVLLPLLLRLVVPVIT